MVLDFLRRSGTEAGPSEPPEQKASATGPVIAWQGGGRVVWSPRDVASLTKNGFVSNPVGFRCVKLIAEAAAAIPLICQDAERRYDVHPVLELINRPNGAQGRAELLEALIGHLLLSGNGYVEAVGDGGLPFELHVLRSDRMNIVPGSDGWPVAYDYVVGGKKVRFDMGAEVPPICHIKSFHPTDDHYGLSPISAAAAAIDVHNSASSWAKGLLDNAARPSGAIVYRGADGGPGTLTADQYDRLLSEMEMHHMGARNAGRPMLLEGGLDWKQMGFSLSDMEFMETKRDAAREIATAFGVPPMLLGIQSDGSFETRTTEASIPGEEDPTASSSDLAMCLTGTEGLRIAERWLAESRIAMDTVSFTLPPSAANANVGDVVELTYGDCRANFRIDRIEIGDARKVEAVRVEPDLFRPSKDVKDDVSLPKPAVAMPVFSRFLDLPLITGNEDPVAPYIAVTAQPWPGSVAVYSSVEDDGYSLNTVVHDQSVFGLTQTPLVAASCGLIDRGAQLQVRIQTGVLSSTTRTALLNGANSLAIGNAWSKDWEVLQFEDAGIVAQDTYVLSGLLRGQLGTDAVMPPVWPEGSLVVLLDGAPSQIELSSSLRGLERHYRVGPADRGYSDGSYEHIVHAASGAGLRPYSPVHLKLVKGADGSELFSWIRRSRIDGDSWEGLEIPLGEDSERYLVQVLEADGTVIREAEADQPSWTYSAEMKAADAAFETAAVQVAQMSERYGVGPFLRIEIHD